MQRAAVLPRLELRVAPVGLGARTVLHERDHAVERGGEALQAGQVDVGDAARGELARLDERRNAVRGEEGQRLVVGGDGAHPRGEGEAGAGEGGGAALTHGLLQQGAGPPGVGHELQRGGLAIAQRHGGRLRGLHPPCPARRRGLGAGGGGPQLRGGGGDQRVEEELAAVHPHVGGVVVHGGQVGFVGVQRVEGVVWMGHEGSRVGGATRRR
jgi:hypothetical protein